MAGLSQQRCLNHAAREAVARCPECRQYYCRECVTEHDERIICAACLKKISLAPETRRWRLTGLVRAAQVMGGIVVVWLFFHVAGRSLLSFENYVHESSLWKTSIEENP